MKPTTLNEAMIQQSLWYYLRSGSRVVVPNYTPRDWHECDVYQITKAMFWIEFEIKISASDFHADFNKKAKHEALRGGYGNTPKRFWYVMPEDIAEMVRDDIPDYAGLMIATPWGNSARLERAKEAPNLRSAKASEETIHRIQHNCYWRYWDMRRQRLAWQAKGLK